MVLLLKQNPSHTLFFYRLSFGWISQGLSDFWSKKKGRISPVSRLIHRHLTGHALKQWGGAIAKPSARFFKHSRTPINNRKPFFLLDPAPSLFTNTKPSSCSSGCTSNKQPFSYGIYSNRTLWQVRLCLSQHTYCKHLAPCHMEETAEGKNKK